MKTCICCSIEKELTFFSKDKRQKDGYFYYCKECCSKKDKRRYANNSEELTEKAKEYYVYNKKKVKNRHLKKTYGISLECFNKMREEQLFSCLICKEHEDNLPKGLFVDHCHTTEKVRGLLCQHCNFLLGMAKDNKQTLLEAIKYLEKAKDAMSN